jgi:hypothetical protein
VVTQTLKVSQMKVTCPKGRAVGLLLYSTPNCENGTEFAVSNAFFMDLPLIKHCEQTEYRSYQVQPNQVVFYTNRTLQCSTVIDRIPFSLPLEVPKTTSEAGSTATKCLVSEQNKLSAHYACDKNAAFTIQLSWLLTSSLMFGLLF